MALLMELRNANRHDCRYLWKLQAFIRIRRPELTVLGRREGREVPGPMSGQSLFIPERLPLKL